MKIKPEATKKITGVVVAVVVVVFLPIIHCGWNSADLCCCNADMVGSRAGVQSALNVRKVQLK